MTKKNRQRFSRRVPPLRRAKEKAGSRPRPPRRRVPEPALEPIKIADGLHLIGVGRQPDGSFAVALHTEAFGQSGTVIIPFDEVVTPTPVKRALARVGYLDDSLKNSAGAVLTALNSGTNLPRILLSDGNGWHDDFRAYAFGGELIGKPTIPIVLLPTLDESRSSGMLAMGRANGGSWQAWRDGMAPYVQRSDVLLSAICFALASTMASRLNIESGLVHFYGPSTIGKTLTLVAAWSAFGACARELLPNWNATPAGLEDLLDVCNDAPFVCDELTFVEGTNDAVLNLKKLSYAIASNRRKARSRHWPGGGASTVRRGRTLFLSTGEVALGGLARDGIDTRRLGERCRAIDINVDERKGYGIFRKLPKDRSLADIAREIETCCNANYGHPGYRFNEALIEEHDEWPARAEAAMTQFKGMAGVSATNLENRFAQRFALAYAAGLEARRCGLLNISAEEIAAALKRLYERAVRSLPDPVKDAKRALKRLRHHLREGSNVTSLHSGKRLSMSDLANETAFRRDDRKKGAMFMVKPQFLEKLCGQKEVWKAAIGILRKSGYLFSDGRDSATRQQSMPGLSQRPRFVCIKVSFLDSES